MVNKKRLVETFCELVTIDSVSGDEKQIITELTKQLKKLNFEVRSDVYGNCIAVKKGLGEPLLLSAHVDTVEPGRGVVPVVANDCISSTGNTILGSDNKAAVAAILETLKVLEEKKITHRSLEIVFTVSEEVANLGAVNLDYSSIKAKIGYCFDSAQKVGTIITASPYYNHFDLAIIGKYAHASRPQSGINALSITAKALVATPQGQLDEDTLANIGVITGGKVRNTVIGEVQLQGEVRSFSPERLEEYTRMIIETFTQICEKNHGRLEVEVVRENDGYQLSQDNVFVSETAKKIIKAGLPVLYNTTWGCADTNIFREHGIEVLNLGYGGENVHTTRESIKISELSKLTEVIINLLIG